MAYFKECPICHTVESFGDDELARCMFGCYEIVDGNYQSATRSPGMVTGHEPLASPYLADKKDQPSDTGPGGSESGPSVPASGESAATDEGGDDPPIDPTRSQVDFVGPFEYHAVCINGWRVPYLTARPVRGGRVDLTLDHRYGLGLALTDAERILPFIANAIAIASGYTAHPSESTEELLPPTQRHPFNRMISLEGDGLC